MTTLKAGGLDFSDIGAKRYGHGSAQNVAGATVQPLMPQFRNSEHYYGKRYVVVVKKCCGTATFFSTTTYAAIRNIIMESGIKTLNYHNLHMQASRRWSYKFLLLMEN